MRYGAHVSQTFQLHALDTRQYSRQKPSYAERRSGRAVTHEIQHREVQVCERLEAVAVGRYPYTVPVAPAAPVTVPEGAVRTNTEIGLGSTPSVRIDDAIAGVDDTEGLESADRSGFDREFATLTPDEAAGYVIPVGALFGEDAGNVSKVWVVGPDNTVQSREVTIGRITTGGVQITEGLKAGERVATAGVHTLSEGQEVIVQSVGG